MVHCPKTIQLGYTRIRLMFDDKRLPEGKENGLCLPDQGLIIVSPKQSPREVVNTVLHELKHMMFYLGHLKEEDGEEHLVTVLTNFEVELFVRNRRLLAWVQQELSRPQ